MGNIAEHIDPELAAIAATLPPGSYADPQKRREQVAAFLEHVRTGTPAWMEGLRHEAVVAPGLDGEPPVRIRLIAPREGPTTTAAIIWFHGGGFVSGHVDSDVLISGRYAAETGATVIHVDYRLAPEDPYPSAVHDGYAALLWAESEGPAAAGIDPSQLVVAGSSAGGGLAAAVALMARDRSGPPLAFQHLLYPALDDRLLTESSTSFIDVPLFTSSMVREMWTHYLGDRAGAEDTPTYAAPAREHDLTGLPSTYLMTAQLDPLRDEGAAYARRLMECGVAVEYHNFAGSFHAFMNLNAALAHRAQAEQFDVLRARLAQIGS